MILAPPDHGNHWFQLVGRGTGGRGWSWSKKGLGLGRNKGAAFFREREIK